MPAKRKATTSASGSKKGSKQAKSEDQDTVSKKIVVPVDEGFNGAPSASVYIDDDGVIYDASLNQSDVRANNNKFYRLQLLEANGRFWHHNRWGRLGEFGQRSTSGPGEFDDMLKEFSKKFKDKTGLKWENRKDEPKAKKYTYLERNYEEDEDEDEGNEDENPGSVKKEEEEDEEVAEPESKLDPAVQALVGLIFDEKNLNATLWQMGYNQEKLPLGKLSKDTLLKGFSYLQELEGLIRKPSVAQSKHDMSLTEATEHFSNRYYSTIPHIGARKRDPLPLIDNIDILKREIDMLDSLDNMGITNEIMQTTRQQKKQREKEQIARIDKQFGQLNLNEATSLDTSSNEYEMLSKYLVNTSGHTHNLKYKIHGIFKIDRTGEAERFEKSYGAYKNTQRRLLWHGSRTTNYGGILSQGLRIAPPEAPVSGYMFGKGIYLADISTKSAAYCFGNKNSDNLIMVCEAELGDPMLELYNADYDAPDQCKKQKRIATHGKGRTVPAGWTDASIIHKDLEGILMPDPEQSPRTDGGDSKAYLQYNEYIAYDVAQIRIRYLIRFSH